MRDRLQNAGALIRGRGAGEDETWVVVFLKYGVSRLQELLRVQVRPLINLNITRWHLLYLEGVATPLRHIGLIHCHLLLQLLVANALRAMLIDQVLLERHQRARW